MKYALLQDYEKHPDAKVNPNLLWEYDLSDFDFQQMKSVVIQRVIERGWPDDWYVMLNLYGEKEVAETIKVIPYLNDRDINFVSKVFRIPLSKMKCCKKKQSRQAHWNS